MSHLEPLKAWLGLRTAGLREGRLGSAGEGWKGPWALVGGRTTAL